MRDRFGDALIIFEEEFRRQTRRIGWRIFTAGVPVLLLIATLVVPFIVDAVSGDGDSRIGVIGLVDDSGVTYSLGEIPGIQRFDSVEVGLGSISDNRIKNLFHVEADYLANGSVDWYRQGSGFNEDESAEFAVRNLLRIAIADESLNDQELARLADPARIERFSVDSDGSFEKGGDISEQFAEAAPPFIFALLLMISIFVGSAALLQSVAEEKENRMVEMLITSTSPMAIMTGKVLGLGAAGLLQVGVWVGSAAIAVPRISGQFDFLSDLSLDPTLLTVLLLYYLAGYFVFAALMASIGAISTSVREASQISALVTLPAVIPVWLSSLVLASPDGGLARVLTFFPLTSPTAVMMRLSGGSNHNTDMWLGFVTTSLSAVVLVWLSARIFRAGLLLYGQRMSVPAIWSAVRSGD